MTRFEIATGCWSFRRGHRLRTLNERTGTCSRCGTRIAFPMTPPFRRRPPKRPRGSTTHSTNSRRTCPAPAAGPAPVPGPEPRRRQLGERMRRRRQGRERRPQGGPERKHRKGRGRNPSSGRNSAARLRGRQGGRRRRGAHPGQGWCAPPRPPRNGSRTPGGERTRRGTVAANAPRHPARAAEGATEGGEELAACHRNAVGRLQRYPPDRIAEQALGDRAHRCGLPCYLLGPRRG